MGASRPYALCVSSHCFEIEGTWDGQPLGADEWARVELELGGDVVVRVEATDYGDPPPPAPAGRMPGLWDFEVVELFLLGRDDRYLEIELGPHGHWLGLSLAGRRRIVDDAVPVELDVQRAKGRWSAEARIASRWLPEELRAANAYAIHGTGRTRRYLATYPVPGDGPDFHRLEHFGPLPGP